MEFQRADLLQLEPISCRGTLKLLPPGKKKKVNQNLLPLHRHSDSPSFIFFLLLNSKKLLLVMILGILAVMNLKKENQLYELSSTGLTVPPFSPSLPLLLFLM